MSSVLDRNHFDNPVYTYQGNAKRDDDLRLLNNLPQIRNNLVKQTNFEKQKFGIPSCSNSEGDVHDAKSAFNSELQALKNKDADSTNPNIYHSIEKLDHVYDEIKQKDVKDLGKYGERVTWLSELMSHAILVGTVELALNANWNKIDEDENEEISFCTAELEKRLGYLIFPFVDENCNNFFICLTDLYDHLDYTRPQSSVKPHYQRMPNLIATKNNQLEEKPDADDVWDFAGVIFHRVSFRAINEQKY